MGMRLFTCHSCANLLFFENSICLRCTARVGFDPLSRELVTLPATGLRPCSGDDPCCNWLVAEDDPETRCVACRTTVVHPQPGGPDGLAWSALEQAKRRLFHTLMGLDLPLDGLTFAFQNEGLTGHADGLITVVLAEADDGERLKRQRDLGEPFRTLSAHLRHECGHFYHRRLVLDSPLLDEVRSAFGDERADYALALKTYYQHGAPAAWADTHVTAYAAAHPHEDWAETWAHYLHLVDALEIAAAYGLSLAVRPHAGAALVAESQPGDQATSTFDELIAAWHPLIWFANSLNRSLGHSDWYPCAPGPAVVEKLRLVDKVIRSGRTALVAA